MWENAKQAANIGGWKKRLGPTIRKLFRSGPRLDLPDWEDDLEKWLTGAADQIGWDQQKELGCLNFPREVVLAARFPAMFRREVVATPSESERLLKALKEAENLSAIDRRDPSAEWGAGTAALVGMAAGLGVDELLGLGGGGLQFAAGAAGGILALAIRQLAGIRVGFTESQGRVREEARVWVARFLIAHTGRVRFDPVPEMFHDWILRGSATNRKEMDRDEARELDGVYAGPRASGRVLTAIEESELLAALDDLVKSAKRFRERRFRAVGTELRDELARDPHGECARLKMHRLIWELWGPPAGTVDKPT